MDGAEDEKKKHLYGNRVNRCTRGTAKKADNVSKARTLTLTRTVKYSHATTVLHVHEPTLDHIAQITLTLFTTFHHIHMPTRITLTPLTPLPTHLATAEPAGVNPRRHPPAAAASPVGRVVRRPLAAHLARAEVARHRSRVLRPRQARPVPPILAVAVQRARGPGSLARAVGARAVRRLAEHGLAEVAVDAGGAGALRAGALGSRRVPKGVVSACEGRSCGGVCKVWRLGGDEKVRQKADETPIARPLPSALTRCAKDA